MIFLMASLYLALADAPSEAGVTVAIIVSALVGVAGAWYAIDSKRLSR
ncbi:MAG: hypothetical protein AB1793_04060 [Candidatus Thermoplasmatota archaeon]